MIGLNGTIIHCEGSQPITQPEEMKKYVEINRAMTTKANASWW